MIKNENSDKNVNSLSNPKILNIFIKSLKSLHKQQENKKKNYKKLMNLFSVKVQKYEDSSSHNKTDEKFKIRKSEFVNKITKKRRSKNSHPSHNYGKNLQKSKKNYESSNLQEIILDRKNLDQDREILYEDYDKNERECNEYNSDSSIFTHNKEIPVIDPDEDSFYRRRITKSMNKNKSILSERAKLVKHKFNKQIDLAKMKKFCKEENYSYLSEKNSRNYSIIKPKSLYEANTPRYSSMDSNSKKGDGLINFNNFNTYNINVDTSLYNSYKSVNSSDRKNSKISEEIVNYYLFNGMHDDKDLILYNPEEGNEIKYDENYKCYYSLDHKSRIIYIKPSPKLLSILNSKIISRRTTHNISKEESNQSRTPKRPEEKLEMNEMNLLNFDPNMIVEKLKNIELQRNTKEVEVNKTLKSESDEDVDSEDFN
jgi:hypothetical protein